jgi:molybdopterin-guanine dinucleotide biosynthesis protein MobB
MPVPVVSVVGSSNVGKTTFVVKLIAELKRRGYRVGTIKHYRHEFEVDQPGKDSWRHAQAGSDVAVIAGPHKIALVQRLKEELTLRQILSLMIPTDIVLTEGYKGADTPKIEVFRQAQSRALVAKREELVALVTDKSFPDVLVPQFGLDDAVGVASLLEDRYLHPGAKDKPEGE